MAVLADELLRRLFDGPAPHDIAAIISARDAADRAAQLDTPGEALGLLRCAQLSGDELLAKAIAVRAAGLARLSTAWDGVVHEWADRELARIDTGCGSSRGWAPGKERAPR